MAARLSEDGSSVLVIEAGIDETFSLINHELSATPGGDVIGVGSSNGDLINGEPGTVCLCVEVALY